MIHCLSLFGKEILSGVDKWLEFQNNTNISEETFRFMGNVFCWVVAVQMLLCGHCHFFVFKCLSVSGFFDVSSDWQTFVCQNKRLKQEFLFMQ